MKAQIVSAVLVLVLLVNSSSGFGLFSGQYGNPMFGGLAGCGCGCSPSMYGYSGLALAKMPMGLGCSSCCLSKPCLLTKLCLLKKKLLEKKMSHMMGCCCKPMCCGMM